MKADESSLSGRTKQVQSDLMSGLVYTHLRLNDNTKKNLESSSFLYALIELLDEKGLISIEDLDERKKAVAGRLMVKFAESGIGLMYQDQEYDKYAFEQGAEVDCHSCLHICKAVCCKMPFALSKQDVEEGVIRWEFGRPYMIAHGEDGYCVHLDRETFECTAHEHRPVPCRGFDCRNNDRWPVWSDYETRTLNVGLSEIIEGSNEAFYAVPK